MVVGKNGKNDLKRTPRSAVTLKSSRPEDREGIVMTYPNSNLSSPNQGSSTQFGNDVNGVASVPQGQQKSKVVAAVLAFFLGQFGAHNFYLGYTGAACAQLALCVVSILLMLVVVGFFTYGLLIIWILVEFIMILVGSSRFATDARGVPVR